MSFEQLPDSILRNIFRHVETRDLLNLCCISGELYPAASECLYRNIMVMDERESVEDEIDLEVLKWASSDYTTSFSRRKLTETLQKKPELGDLVKSLSINTFDDRQTTNLYNFCGNLQQFHDPSESYRFPIFTNISRVSCHLQCLPRFDNTLTELRLLFSESRYDEELFAKMASLLIKDGVHANLKTLSLEHSDISEYGHPDTPEFMDVRAPANAPWLSFFRRFVDGNITLKLKALCLQGLVKDPGEMFTCVSKAVSLKDLEILELSIVENSHHGTVHLQPNDYESFMTRLAGSVPKLTTLHINHCSPCSDCDSNDIVSALQVLSLNQLEKLSIHQGSPGVSSVMMLHGLIMASQRNLVSLSYRDEKFTADLHAMDSSEKYSLMNISDQSCLNEEYRQQYTSRILASEGGAMIVSRECEDSLKIQGKAIVELLESDIIYVSGTKIMPRLTEYRREGFCVDMKRNLIIINGRRYNLAPYANQKRRDETSSTFNKSLSLYTNDDSLTQFSMEELLEVL